MRIPTCARGLFLALVASVFGVGRERAELMEFVEAVRLVYHLANEWNWRWMKKRPANCNASPKAKVRRSILRGRLLHANNIG
jgi:hypothetical protein